jgi:hypothetical protein
MVPKQGTGCLRSTIMRPLYGARLFTTSLRTLRRPLKNAFSLDEWLFRKEIFKLYRRIVRTAFKTHEKKALVTYAKGEFQQNSKVLEMSQRRYLLNMGMRQYRDLSKTMGFLMDVNLALSDMDKPVKGKES